MTHEHSYEGSLWHGVAETRDGYVFIRFCNDPETRGCNSYQEVMVTEEELREQDVDDLMVKKLEELGVWET